MSTRHQLHICMSQVQIYVCIADSLFICTMAKLLHSWCAVCNVSYSACISLMFSRWQGCFVVHSSSTNMTQNTSPTTWMRTSNMKWSLDLLRSWGIEWPTMVHSITFNSNISKNEFHELGEPCHTLLINCGLYTRIKNDKTQVYLS